MKANMYALVKFHNNYQGIYHMKHIKLLQGDLCIVNHNGCKYEASLLKKDDVKDNLKKCYSNIQKDPTDISVSTNGSINLDDFSFGPEMIDINSSNSFLGKEFDLETSKITGESENETSVSQHYHEELEEIDNHGNWPSCSEYNCEEPEGQLDDHHGNEPSCSKNYCDEPSKILDDFSDFDDDSVEDPMYEPSDQSGAGGSLEEEPAVPTFLRDISNTEQQKRDKISTSFNDSVPHCDDTEMYVSQSRGKSGDKKANFCLYCKTKQFKIARHLENKHKAEKEIQKFIHLPKGNMERKRLIGEIRKKGNFLFNTNRELNDGELIVSRRPQQKFTKTGVDFRACAKCKAFFSRKALRIHFKKCTGINSSHRRLPTLLSKKITARLHPKASEIVKKNLFPPLRDDSIVRLIRYDELVIIYANKMVEKYKNYRYFEMIRQRIRLIGRFLQTLKSINKDVTDLSSIYDPKFIDDTLITLNQEARFNPLESCYETPTVAFNIGTLLKQIGNMFVNECIKNHNDEKIKNTKNYIKLLTEELNINVNRTVAESQMQIKRRKQVELPTVEDIKLLRSYTIRKRNMAFEKLIVQFDNNSWLVLTEATLLSIQIFNRRRPGELERILIDDFKHYHGVESTDKDLYESLSAVNKGIAKKYMRFEIRGKLNRTVPVLLDNNMLDCLNLILKLRSEAGVPEQNPYVFGCIGTNTKEHKYLRACNIMRKYAHECRAAHPERLRGTKLRKHMATTCVSLNLQEHDVSDLANFMGHDEKIHRNIYRQPIVSREILRMSRLLEAAQGESDYNSGSDCEGDEDEGAVPKESPKETEKVPRKRSTSPFGPVRRVKWTEDERSAIFHHFNENLMNRTLPSLTNIQQVKNMTPALKNRTSPQIKTWLSNQMRSKKKISNNT